MVRHEYRTIPLKRRGTGYLVGKYVYIKDRLEGGNLFLRCQRYRTCPARGLIVGSNALDCYDLHHNHPAPDVLAMIFRSAAIQMAKDPNNMCLTTKAVYSKTVTAFVKDGLADETRLPPFREVKWAIKDHRIKKVRGWKVYVNKKKAASASSKKNRKCELQGCNPSTCTHSTNKQPQGSTPAIPNQMQPSMIGVPIQMPSPTAGIPDQMQPPMISIPNQMLLPPPPPPTIAIPNQLQQQPPPPPPFGIPALMQQPSLEGTAILANLDKQKDYDILSKKLIQQAKELETLTGCKISLEIIPNTLIGMQHTYKSKNFPAPAVTSQPQ